MNYIEGISVVIPVYNAEKYIEECINSIIAQSYKNLQIICVNDGSEDNSSDLLHNLANTDDRISVIDTPNGGAAKARNIGITKAICKYLTFVDADDTIESNMYEEMISFGNENHLDCVVCNTTVYPYKQSPVKMTLPFADRTIFKCEDIVHHIVARSIGFEKANTDGLYSLWNKLFRTEIINKNDLRINAKRTHGEDWEFCMEYLAHALSCGFIDKCFYNYIHHTKQSLVTKFRPEAYELSVETEKKFKRLFPSLDWNTPFKKEQIRNLPFEWALYYREHLRGGELITFYEMMFELTKVNADFLFYVPIENQWENDFRQSIYENELQSFVDILNDRTLFKYIAYKVKKTIKEAIRKCKYVY